jgi:Putative transposase DNA-binding domain
MENINEQLDIKLSRSPNNYIEYTKWRLKWLLYLQQMYCKKKVVQLKMEAYMRIEKTLHKYKLKLVPKNEKTLIVWGDATIASNSPVKGYVRTPKNKLLELLKNSKNCKVIMQDEFRTTKLCCKCYEPLNISTDKHRYAVCPNCRTVFNRDVNAGANILHLAIKSIKKEITHTNFCRSVKLNTITRSSFII